MIDILQIIKKEHLLIKKQIKDIIKSNNNTEKMKLFTQMQKLLNFHLKFEKEYLYQEAESYIKNLSNFITTSLDNHKQIDKLLHNISKSFKKLKTSNNNINKIIDQLYYEIDSHFLLEEEIFMPKIRTYMPTDDREDMGATYLDLKTEFINQVFRAKSKKIKTLHELAI